LAERLSEYQAQPITLPISFNINLDHHLIGKSFGCGSCSYTCTNPNSRLVEDMFLLY